MIWFPLLPCPEGGPIGLAPSAHRVSEWAPSASVRPRPRGDRADSATKPSLMGIVAHGIFVHLTADPSWTIVGPTGRSRPRSGGPSRSTGCSCGPGRGDGPRRGRPRVCLAGRRSGRLPVRSVLRFRGWAGWRSRVNVTVSDGQAVAGREWIVAVMPAPANDAPVIPLSVLPTAVQRPADARAPGTSCRPR